MKQRSYNSALAFLDVLFNTLLGFVALFFIAFILINPKNEQKKSIEAKAEFIITVTWPEESNDDVDSYLEDPLGHLVFFRRREDGLMHLDRDDQGQRHDFIRIGPGDSDYIIVRENREIITIRGIIPGEYIMNIHMYSKYKEVPCSVTVRVEKINPMVTTVMLKTMVLEKNGDEKTICRFSIDKNGDVSGVSELPKRIAGPSLRDIPYNQPNPNDEYDPLHLPNSPFSEGENGE